jgi:hypothetical protein
MIANRKLLSIPLLGILLLNTFIDVFLGAIALGHHNFMIVGVLAIAFAIQGMFMVHAIRNIFC